jgi:ribonuclease BN (tRNA processing enzyme)
MTIKVLGSASGLPTAERNSSAYWIETAELTCLIDTGDGVARQLVRYGLNANQLDCVFISHMHSDHVTGLFMLLQLMHLTGRKEPFYIYLPEGVFPGFESVFPYFQIFKENWPYSFSCTPISEGLFFTEGNFQISAVSNKHLSQNKSYAQKAGVGTDCYSFIFGEKADKLVIYTSDMDSLDHLSRLKQKAQVLLSECTHVSIESIIEFAQNKKIPKIVFTHIHPDLEKIKYPYADQSDSPSIQFAQDGNCIEV